MRTRRWAIALVLLSMVIFSQSARASQTTAVAGVPRDAVGVHGPTLDYAAGDLQLVGHADMTPPGGSTPLGNNGGIALVDHCAYVGRWHEYGDPHKTPPLQQHGIQIVDVADPTAPKDVGEVANGWKVTDAVSREIRGIDLPTFRLLTVLTFSKYTDEGVEVAGQNSIYFFAVDLNDCTKVSELGQYDLRSFRPHEFFQWLDPNPAHNVDGHPRILEYITSPVNGADVEVIDASRPASPKLLSIWHSGMPLASAPESNVVGGVPVGAGNYTHSISISGDGTRAFVSHWDGGYFTMDTSDFASAVPTPVFKPLGAQSVPYSYTPTAFGNTHSAVPLAGTNDAVVGDEIYATTDGCPFGWMRIVNLGDASTPPHQVGEYKLRENDSAQCSGGLAGDKNAVGQTVDGTFTMHNQTVTDRFVLTTWYGGGLRVVDLQDPTHPAEAGFFVPAPVSDIMSVPDTTAPVYGKTAATSDDWWVAAWSYPIVRDGLIYFADMRNGLYILRAKPHTSLAANIGSIGFLEGNSNLGDFIPMGGNRRHR